MSDDLFGGVVIAVSLLLFSFFVCFFVLPLY